MKAKVFYKRSCIVVLSLLTASCLSNQKQDGRISSINKNIFLDFELGMTYKDINSHIDDLFSSSRVYKIHPCRQNLSIYDLNNQEEFYYSFNDSVCGYISSKLGHGGTMEYSSIDSEDALNLVGLKIKLVKHTDCFDYLNSPINYYSPSNESINHLYKLYLEKYGIPSSTSDTTSTWLSKSDPIIEVSFNKQGQYIYYGYTREYIRSIDDGNDRKKEEQESQKVDNDI